MNYGFVKSKFDGTEKKFAVPKSMKIPNEFSYLKQLPEVLNQGIKPICVPCSVESYVDWKLNLKDGKIRNNKADIDSIFKKYGTKDGMTFKDALHYLRHEGIKTDKGLFKIDSYATIGSIDALKCAVVMNGPCIGGLPVYNSSSQEFWNGNSLEGGHAISIVGFDKDGFIIRNSWGPYFGNKGYTHLSYSDFNKFYEIWTLI